MMNLTIPNVVGRRWGGGGGGRHRGLGGYGGYSYFASPCFAAEEVIELGPGAPVRIVTAPRAPTLLSGTGTGRRDRELADLGALLAPGASGLSAQFSLGADRRLYASICIDGECYEGTVDLAHVLDRIAEGVASEHAAWHPAPVDLANDPGAVEGTANAANAAVEAAGDLLVGALIDQHSATVSAGWWHSLTRSISHAVSDVHHAVTKTVQKFKAPISVAATAVATVYGGPAGGAAAAKLTGPIIDAMAGDGRANKGAKAVVDAAHAAAQSDPRLAKALADAHKAVSDTAAAYHLTSTAANAAGGDPDAARKLADLDRAAQGGDAAAQRAMSVITEAFATATDEGAPTASGGLPVLPFALGAAAGMGGYAWWRHHQAQKARRAAAAIEHPAEAPPPGSAAPVASAPGPVASGELIGAAISTLRSAAKSAVAAAYEPGGDTAFGYVKDARGTSVRSFPTLDDADDWFGALNPRRYLYAAYFDASDPTWPSPINEQLGGPAAASARAHASRGLL
jgi:hypothetical protein